MSTRWQPLLWYVGVALGLPILNGARVDADFLEHASTVLAVSGAVTTAGWWVRRRRGRPPQPTAPEARP
jgi:hypothetical protein